jgi:hypothetical protein
MKQLDLISNEDYSVKFTVEKCIDQTNRLAIVRYLRENKFAPQTTEFYLTDEEMNRIKEWFNETTI